MSATEASMPHAADLLSGVIDIAVGAGAIIMEVYGKEFATREKSDRSPVTEADERAEAYILPRLRALDASIPIVSEEAAEKGEIPDVGQRFWLVDPLDGTKEFISRNGEFTVNIALISDGRPVLGVVLAPALDRLFAADGREAYLIEGGARKPLRVRAVPEEGLTVVASRSHGDAAALDSFLAGRKVANVASAGSSLKLCLVASGEADVYPRLGRTMEWDIAAGHAVLLAAGGAVHNIEGQPLRYGKPGFDNPHFVAYGQAEAFAS